MANLPDTVYRMEPDGMSYPAAGYRIPDNSRRFRAILSQFRAILSVFDKFFHKNLSKTDKKCNIFQYKHAV